MRGDIKTNRQSRQIDIIFDKNQLDFMLSIVSGSNFVSALNDEKKKY